MDFDSFITLIIIVGFFIFPAILKRLKTKKQTISSLKSKKGPLSFWGKIGEQIQQFIEELEQQAQQQRAVSDDQENVWETLSDDEDSPVRFVGGQADTNVDASEIRRALNKEGPPRIKRNEALQGQYREKEIHERALETKPKLKRSYRLNDNPLQNAIIWSEILSKPVALRKE